MPMDFQTPPPAGGFGAVPVTDARAFGPYAVPLPPSETYAKITMTFGVMSVLGFFLCFAGLPFGLAAIGMGIHALKRCATYPDRYAGRGYAAVGLVLGSMTTLICAVFVAVWLLLL